MEGKYAVALNEEHFKELVLEQSQPPPSSTKIETSLIKMGFPRRTDSNHASLCVWLVTCVHDPNFDSHQKAKYDGYTCPQCLSKFCELPTECQICGITLVSSAHLARSYHHLFPVPPFQEPDNQLKIGVSLCYGCQQQQTQNSLFVCSRCKQKFCPTCDEYIRDALHNCPGCEMIQKSK